jgi:hypothetical protein
MPSPIPTDVTHLPDLLDDLDHAVAQMKTAVDDPSIWTRGPAGRWTLGQHVEHSARLLAMSALEFERASDALTRGQLPKRPWRDPIQGIFVKVVTGKRFPRGARSPGGGRPAAMPDRMRALHDLEEGARRHRIVADRLAPGIASASGSGIRMRRNCAGTTRCPRSSGCRRITSGITWRW